MKDKVKELLALIKGNKPCYFIQYTVQDGEIIILDGHKSHPTDNNGKHPDLIWGDAMSELRPDDEVIAKFEKEGISWDKAKEFRERLEQEAERDKAFLH